MADILLVDTPFEYSDVISSSRPTVLFALGIKESGEYEILGFYLTIKESHNNYKDVLEDLYRRGNKIISYH